MAALAADVNAATVGRYTSVGLACGAGGDTFYRGSLVYIKTAGGVLPTFNTSTAGDRAIGYSPKKQVCAATAEVEVVVHGAVWLPIGTNVAVDHEGEWLINDGPTNTDNPGDLQPSGHLTLVSADMICGKILRVTSTQMLIWIDPVWMGAEYFSNGTPANYSGWGLHLA